MADPLVETKLLLPRPRRGVVPRPRLADLLRRGADASLTLVSAPPGFGKTTLLGAWLAGAAQASAAAWVSCDERDREGTSFWTYVLLALDRAAPGTGAGALTLLQTGQAPIETVLAGVVNELSVLPYDVTLVLDDYHLADGPGIQAGMGFLVDHLPPQLHLVVSTRADPVLPLARLRARGELVEVRAADLRFTTDEAAAYLNDAAGLDLAAEDVAALETRTEGWAAALQLAALSLRDRDDVAGFVAGFAGDDRYVVDYLADEVLDRQPDDVRRFLLDTSVLDRLTGPLCDAVTRRRDGRAMLRTLDRQNLFVVPLDDHRRWYRYHHLFADVLHAHVLEERPGELPQLHRRASDWYDEAGHPEPAVRHALAAGDVDRAADLVELAVPAKRRERREAVLRRWLDDLPADVVQRRPVLAAGFVGALMASNEFDGVDQRLRDIERLLSGPADDLRVVDHHELRRLPGAVETYWAALALIAGDPAGTVEHADLAIARAPEDDRLTLAAASALSGLASWGSGDLDAAHRKYAAAAQGLGGAGYVADVLGCSITLADIEMTQGRLSDARRTFEHALALAEREDPGLREGLRGTADMYVGLSRVACERDELAAAADYLRRADELGESAGLPQNPYRWRLAMARIREAEGDPTAALGLLDEAIRLYVGDFSPNVRPLEAVRARVQAASGDLGAALAWAGRQGLSAADELSYLREYEHITLVRILLAQHSGDAIGLLDRLLAAAQDGGRGGTVIELLVLRALAHHASGDTPEALASLERALKMAEPEGYVRVFANEGAAMVDLMTRLQRARSLSSYERRILDATATRPRHDQQALVDPLSDRELDVLRLLASDLDGPAIARHLVVSLNTVRTHTKHIYAKLGVNNRRAAVRQAHQLNLLTGR